MTTHHRYPPDRPVPDRTTSAVCWRDDRHAITATMAAALQVSHPCWANVNAREIMLTELGGFGGGNTFRVDRRGDEPPSPVVLHILGDAYCPDPGDTIFFDRKRQAQAVFAARALGPHRICEDPDKEWFVEEWGGDVITGEARTVDLIGDVADLVARIHAIPTSWADDTRARQRLRYPALADAPDASHIWPFAGQAHFFVDRMTAALQRHWIETEPHPASMAAARLVTLHGDIHEGNVVRSNGKLGVIDMDFACAGYAIHDIAYVLDTLCETEELKAGFLRAYLLANGMPAESRDVRALRLDAERCKMVTNHFDSNAIWGRIEREQGYEDAGAHFRQLWQSVTGRSTTQHSPTTSWRMASSAARRSWRRYAATGRRCRETRYLFTLRVAHLATGQHS